MGRRKKKSIRQEYTEGLRHLAFGEIQDAVRLLYAPQEPAGLDKLDLFSVAELKRSDKGVEVKFADRLKAAQMLAELDGGEGTQALFSVLHESAQAVRGTAQNGDSNAV